MIRCVLAITMSLGLCSPLLTQVLAQETPASAATSKEERGEYLVKHVAMCVMCHTPRHSDGTLRTAQLLTGASMPVGSPFPDQIWGFRAPNLRSLPSSWGNDAFIEFLQTGKTPNGYSPRPPMPPFRMTKEDATAVAEYLNSLKRQ